MADRKHTEWKGDRERRLFRRLIIKHWSWHRVGHPQPRLSSCPTTHRPLKKPLQCHALRSHCISLTHRFVNTNRSVIRDGLLRHVCLERLIAAGAACTLAATGPAPSIYCSIRLLVMWSGLGSLVAVSTLRVHVGSRSQRMVFAGSLGPNQRAYLEFERGGGSGGRGGKYELHPLMFALDGSTDKNILKINVCSNIQPAHRKN